ncbi:MAG: hypothetical protein AAFQ42_12165, partial [Pseudomonadota bacterium]
MSDRAEDERLQPSIPACCDRSIKTILPQRRALIANARDREIEFSTHILLATGTFHTPGQTPTGGQFYTHRT